MSAPVTNPPTQTRTATPIDKAAHARRTSMPDDGTRQLLQGAFGTLVAGILAALATSFLFGGIGVHGPHTNAGWISLLVAMMCLPFGLMLLLLGGAKYLRNRRIARKDI
jgi:uncharacterized membrane protein YeaQ/YmgE (transglycosylase-associated protein family)